MAHLETTSASPSVRLVKGAQLGSYTPIQQHTLARYVRLRMLRRDLLPRLEPGDWRARLLHKALYSTFLDCQALGLDEEARLLRDGVDG